MILIRLVNLIVAKNIVRIFIFVASLLQNWANRWSTINYDINGDPM